MSPQGAEVGIVGGGMLGMTLALRLAEGGHRVTVVEGTASPGGLASPHRVGDFTWDRFYHVILKSDSHLLGLLAELGLGERLHWRRTRTGFYTDGQLYSLSNSIEFLKFPPLSLLDKARLAATIMYAARIRNWQRLEAIPATEWLARWSGRRTFERIWLPLLRSKLGDNYRIASAAFIWAIIARMYAARRSGMKVEQMGHVDGGYATVLPRFREVLEARGVEFVTGRPVERVLGGKGAALQLADGTRRDFDAVVLTVPCGRVGALCPGLTDEERARLGGVVYQGVVCASVLLRKPLNDFYVTNITDPAPFTGVIEMTALVDPQAFGGHALVYLPRYLVQTDSFWERTDDEIRDLFLGGLDRMYPTFRRDDVVAFKVARAREVLALSTLHYSAQALPPLRTSVPNVFVMNSAQIAAGTLNNNEVVGLVNAKVRELVPLLRAGQRLRTIA